MYNQTLKSMQLPFPVSIKLGSTWRKKIHLDYILGPSSWFTGLPDIFLKEKESYGISSCGWISFSPSPQLKSKSSRECLWPWEGQQWPSNISFCLHCCSPLTRGEAAATRGCKENNHSDLHNLEKKRISKYVCMKIWDKGDDGVASLSY